MSGKVRERSKKDRGREESGSREREESSELKSDESNERRRGEIAKCFRNITV